MELKGREAACFLYGYVACLAELDQPVPDELQRVLFTAVEILGGGTYRGPLVVWDMENVANRIIKAAGKKAKS